jgi:23S rRNA (uracil1939-C5)-methyltransferase
MKKAGQTVDVACAALDERGAGVGDWQGRALHVAGALPGEEVTAAIEHVSPHVRGEAWGRLVSLRRASPERVAPVCPGHGRCGGCPLQHLDYQAQVRWKGERVAAQLTGVRVEECVPSPRPLGYRNQGKYVYGTDQGGLRVLGAYLPRSHTVVDLLGCQVVEPLVDQVARGLRELLVEAEVPPFDEVRRTGLLRYAVIRANAAGAALVTLVIGRRTWSEAEVVARALRAAEPAVTGVVLNLNDGGGNALFGDEERLLDGLPTIEDAIGGVAVELASRSFFQINRGIAELAYAEIAAAARGGRVVDAYAGAGGIAFTLAPAAREVIAIEESSATTAAAAAFAVRRGLAHVRFLTGDAALHLRSVGQADLVVLNPPRSGCAPQVLDAVAALEPAQVAYLSCHPGTLARDVGLFGKRGYVTKLVRPYDMLPHTTHVEALALLERSFGR